ncbi:hypothetical protein [Geodermatophilus sp. DSM 45219]|uniref:hypothetical protein n=1 Tax=Geodermatophilus sp. DSM 45219 TaxID=1881103 RepID=UPI000887AECA|nr:hypothetical protein [Geodermatophilus sp. DSM 45219]SDN79168.1 hypothetical protein SAMN05428965_1643 [Geodermatophilus sp. DSM 45219]
MAAVQLVPEDLTPFAQIERAKAVAMIEDALAVAATVAPCITEADFTKESAARAILRGAILRWNESGNGGLTTIQQTTDDFNQSKTYDNRQTRRGMFWPSEIQQLQNLCQTEKSGAYSIDTLPTSTAIHADICALRLGANYCSCGAYLTGGFPLWETT